MTRFPLCNCPFCRYGGLAATLALTFMVCATRAEQPALAASDEAPPLSMEIIRSSHDPAVPLTPGSSSMAVGDAMPAEAALVTGDRVSIFVTLDPNLPFASAARANVKAFAALRGGIVKYEYETVLPNVLNLRNISRSDFAALAAIPGVQKVEMDEYVPNALLLHDSVPLIHGLQSQITGAGLSADGTGVRVCIVDTGIDTDHVMYSTRIDLAASFDFNNGDSNPEDDNGHGSHCAGIIGGGTGLTVDFGCVGPEPFQGVAPNVTLISAKVLNSAGGGLSSNIVAGINHCANQTPTGGRADIISMSIGTGQFTGACTHAWAVAANNAVAAGVVAVAASGNNNFANAMSSPACGASVISVGATWDENFPNCEEPTGTWNWGVCTDVNPGIDDVVCFSNESDFLDVSAPGCNIYSASIAAGGGNIVAQCGTSMACPHVAGLAALILDVGPSLTPAQVRQLIRDGATDLGAAGFDRGYGWGRIDVVDTLQLMGGGGCTSSPECDDGLFCNGAEACVANVCQPGTAPNCSDGIACTTDSCNESTDSCDHVANNAACDDGLFCTGVETCSVSLGCQAGTDPCGGQQCNEATDTCGAGQEVWMVFAASTTVPGVGTATDEDIVSYNMGTGVWSLIFDGSDVGLSALAIDAMHVQSDGQILLSFVSAGTVAGLIGGPSGTSVDDSDIVRFAPTSLGSTTAGTFTFLFDGSDVGLTTNDEDIDAVTLDSSGRLVFSTLGAFSVTGASGTDADLFAFNATSLGSVTAGNYSMTFDGSDVGLTTTSEDVDAADFTTSGSILLSTLGNFSVTGVSGADEDILEFVPTQLGGTTTGTYSMFLDLSTTGIATSADVIALDLIQ